MGDDTYQVVQKRQSKSERPASVENDFEGPIFVISTTDISFVQGNTEAHYVTRLFGERVETHAFGPISSALPGVTTHSHPFGGALGVFLLNLLSLPYWVYVAARIRPQVVYCYANVVVPPFVVRAVAGAAVVHDLQADPHDQMQEFAERDGGSALLAPLLAGVKLAHRLALPRSDAVVTLSERLKRRIRENYCVAAEDVHVVPLGVDTETFAPRDQTADQQHDRLRIAYLGAIEHYRGLEPVVDALARLDEDHRRRVQFDVFGAGDEAFVAELRRTAEEEGVELVYHGHLDHEAVPDALSVCDLAVSPLPELDSYQVSCPAKVFEYLAMSLPIVATRIPPHEAHLTDGEDAILVAPDDPDSFAAAFERLLDDPDELATMAAAARATALEDDWSERFQQISTVVASAQADGRGHSGSPTGPTTTDQRRVTTADQRSGAAADGGGADAGIASSEPSGEE
jgi:glycosyltransferase involved in cell wall biosynthesis